MPARSFLGAGVLAFVVGTGSASASSLEFESGPDRTALLELYTSEGCSSCPPAEEWLEHLQQAVGLWRDFVPIAFHVDYWDRLGWKDPLATAGYSSRQRAYAQVWNARSVYTPGFVLDGREWSSWRGQALPAPDPSPAGRLRAVRVEDGRFEVTYVPAAAAETDFELHAALLGCGIESEVLAGENGGRTLKHEFTALTLETAELESRAGVLAAVVQLRPRAPLPVRRLAVAFWVTRRGQLEPLQATGGFLP